MTPNINFLFKKNETIDSFIEKIIPVWRAKNSEENIKVYLKYELNKFYNDVFTEGQKNVLNDPKWQKEKGTLF